MHDKYILAANAFMHIAHALMYNVFVVNAATIILVLSCPMKGFFVILYRLKIIF